MLNEIRYKNKWRGITGMLLYKDGEFLQVIEGPEASVDLLLDVLQSDSRHKGIVLLSRTVIPAREFEHWQMAFHNISGEDLSRIDGYSPFMEHSFSSAEFRSRPSVARDMLLTFKQACG